MAAAAPPVSIESAAYARAILNLLEDFGEEKDRLKTTQRAILNVLEDSAQEREGLQASQRAILNILGDFGEERTRLQQTQRAAYNILEDAAEEKQRLQANQKAILNILGDFADEKARLGDVQKALLNILEDFDHEKQRAIQATAELARSNAELEQFAYVASHDLQEPLRMVSAYVQLFEKRYKGHIDEQADKYIRYAVDGAQRMEALIAALLEYSRSGRAELQLATVDANRALALALTSLAAAVEESRAEITHDPLPTLRCDETQLARVLQNLVGNALKFRKPEGRPRVHVSTARRRDAHVFSVRDDGIGIDPAYAERVFVLFQRLHTRAEYPGTGIGLAICKRVVERLGGRIWFESEPGAGATFFFTLPSADAGGAPPAVPGPRPDGS